MTFKVLVLSLLFAASAYAQPVFEAKHQNMLQAYVNKFGLPGLNGDEARTWSSKLAQQFKFSFPDEGWGHKAGGNGRPPSTDVIARQSLFVGFWGYDVILSQGIPSQSLISNPEPINLAGQEYIPVTPFNYVGTTSGGGGGNPIPVPTPVDLGPLTKRVQELEGQLVAIQIRFAELIERDSDRTRQLFELSDYARTTDGEINLRIDLLPKPPTRCSGRVFGRNVNCRLVFE